jgi:hypothetical protein
MIERVETDGDALKTGGFESLSPAAEKWAFVVIARSSTPRSKQAFG